MIAATAIEHNLDLVTGNVKHFERIAALGYPLRMESCAGNKRLLSAAECRPPTLPFGNMRPAFTPLAGLKPAPPIPRFLTPPASSRLPQPDGWYAWVKRTLNYRPGSSHSSRPVL